MLTSIIAGIFLVTLSHFAFWERWLPKKRECPQCAGTKTVTIDKLVEDIETREVGAFSMSSDLITTTKYTYSCQTCGHKWAERIKRKT